MNKNIYEGVQYPNILKQITFDSEMIMLLLGSEKTAIIDTGRAHFGKQLVAKTKKALEGRNLDYIFVSHTHYDHIGALPYFKKEWPNVKVFGSKYAEYVFTRPGALKVIRSMGEAAKEQHKDEDVSDVIIDGLKIDNVLKDKDTVSLGSSHILALETKGHTNCSMTYILEPESIMFSSESIGVMNKDGSVFIAVLTSFEDSIKSLERCKSYNPKHIVSPHFGLMPQEYNNKYYSDFEKNLNDERKYILDKKEKGETSEEIFDDLSKIYWDDERAKYQTWEAFSANARSTIKVYMNENKK